MIIYHSHSDCVSLFHTGKIMHVCVCVVGGILVDGEKKTLDVIFPARCLIRGIMELCTGEERAWMLMHWQWIYCIYLYTNINTHTLRRRHGRCSWICCCTCSKWGNRVQPWQMRLASGKPARRRLSLCLRACVCVFSVYVANTPHPANCFLHLCWRSYGTVQTD